MLSLLKRLWWSWKKVVHGLNSAISWTLMAFVYWSAVFPVAVGFKLFRPDPTDRGLGDPDASTEWQTPRYPRQDISRAQRPF
jgi:hypothetical protein